jgi:rare lipoprotein A
MKFYKDTKNSKINNSKEMHKYTMRPYSVFGIKYYPFIANIGDRFEGIASWYGPDFHSKKTSNGEVYNMYDMTAAHKTLPMNTVLRVENLDNGKSIIVRVNDRGPFVKGRIIDLSNKAANEIDMVRRGTANVRITVLGYNGEIENKNAPYTELAQNEVKPSNQVEKIDVLEPLDIKEDKITTTNVTIPTVGTPVVAKTTVKTPTVNKASVVNNKPKITPLSTGIYSLQVGAFSKIEGAQKTVSDYQRKFSSNKVESEKVFVNGKTLYKVFIKGFKSYDEAQRFKNSNGLTNAMVIK